MSDIETQKDELMALESIYNKEEFQLIEQKGCLGGKFFASITLPPDFKVNFKDLRNKESVAQSVAVQYLPPLCLHFILPSRYPSALRPLYRLSCRWLTWKQLRKLCFSLNNIWRKHKGSEILFLWIQFLVEETLSLLKIEDTLDISILETQYLKESDGQQQLELQKGTSSQVQQQENIRNSLKRTGRCERNEQKYQAKNRYRNEKSGFQNSKEEKRVEKKNSCMPEKSLSKNEPSAEKNQTRNSVHRQRNWRTERTSNDRNADQNITIGRYTMPWVFTSAKYSVMELITNFDASQRHMTFLRNIHSCIICFEDKTGTDCTIFKECGHIFCRACITDYFTLRIKDGTVHTILCPAEKCTAQATPLQIQELVSPELYSRYDSMLLNSLLDTMEDTYYCPRQFCQYPVSVEEGEKMAICPSCNYVFCVYCKRVYHGVESCRFKNDEKQRLVEEYSSCDDTRRKFLEQRYGKQQLQTLVDSSLSEKWLSSNSKKCPNCSAAIEKLDGCNKMVCWKCNTSFCWLCEKALNPRAAPYDHFNNPSSKCFNMLFHGIDQTLDFGVDDFWDEWLNEPDSDDSEHDELFSEDDDDDY